MMLNSAMIPRVEMIITDFAPYPVIPPNGRSLEAVSWTCSPAKGRGCPTKTDINVNIKKYQWPAHLDDERYVLDSLWIHEGRYVSHGVPEGLRLDHTAHDLA